MYDQSVSKILTRLKEDGYCYIYPLFDYMSSRENTEKQNDSCDNSLISPSVLICHPTCHDTLIENILEFISKNLREPYEISTIRYFVELFPYLFLVLIDTSCISKNSLYQEPIGYDHEFESFDKLPLFLDKDYIFSHGKIVGVAISQYHYTRSSDIFKNQKTDEIVGYIGIIVIASFLRKRGLGTLLMSMTIHLLLQLGITQVFIETEVSNYTALRLYDRLGFKRIEYKKNYYASGEDAYLLKKTIVQEKQCLVEANSENSQKQHSTLNE